MAYYSQRPIQRRPHLQCPRLHRLQCTHRSHIFMPVLSLRQCRPLYHSLKSRPKTSPPYSLSSANICLNYSSRTEAAVPATHHNHTHTCTLVTTCATSVERNILSMTATSLMTTRAQESANETSIEKSYYHLAHSYHALFLEISSRIVLMNGIDVTLVSLPMALCRTA